MGELEQVIMVLTRVGIEQMAGGTETPTSICFETGPESNPRATSLSSVSKSLGMAGQSEECLQTLPYLVQTGILRSVAAGRNQEQYHNDDRDQRNCGVKQVQLRSCRPSGTPRHAHRSELRHLRDDALKATTVRGSAIRGEQIQRQPAQW